MTANLKPTKVIPETHVEKLYTFLTTEKGYDRATAYAYIYGVVVAMAGHLAPVNASFEKHLFHLKNDEKNMKKRKEKNEKTNG